VNAAICSCQIDAGMIMGIGHLFAEPAANATVSMNCSKCSSGKSGSSSSSSEYLL